MKTRPDPWELAGLIHPLVERVEYDGEAGAVSATFRPTGIRALEVNHQEA